MPVAEEKAFHQALKQFAQDVGQRFGAVVQGEPEEQLRGPLERLVERLGQILARPLHCQGEVRLPGRLGRPDYAILDARLQVLVGHVELKQPGRGVVPEQFQGHDRRQWERFQALPNLIYSDGNQWALYRNGQRVGEVVSLHGDIRRQGARAVKAEDARRLLTLWTDFLSWQPVIPRRENGQVDQPALARLLAPLCRLLREEVLDALKEPDSPLNHLAQDWRELLFPQADDPRFADAYAQTVTFALLLARAEGADPLSLRSAQDQLAEAHGLLSRALQVLTDRQILQQIEPPIQALVRVVGAVPPRTLGSAEDPWLYFYEDFLAAYDPQLRRDTGVYYTPVQVVRAQVRLIDDLLRRRLGKHQGFAHPEVVTLDPAAGTGTYLLGVIQHVLHHVEEEQGPGAVPAVAEQLAGTLYGFELLVGPFAVAQLRVGQALRRYGALEEKGEVRIYLTDTLESPFAPAPRFPQFLEPIAQQHQKALQVKSQVPVIVCLGNPPYDRHGAAEEVGQARSGGWVRWGNGESEQRPIFEDFLQPARQAGAGVHLKNLYNLYVYFWRWALWKVFESPTATGPGVVSFITASSYLDGPAFCGMRQHMRRVCDEIWILDLGGEGRGTRRSQNVFHIQTPVAIAVAVRYGPPKTDTPATVHYARIEGTRRQKLEQLDMLDSFASLRWQSCPRQWQAPFRPGGGTLYFQWPLLTDLFPWQHSGVQFKRTWPIAPDKEVLRRRWQALLQAEDRAAAFRETRDRKLSRRYPPLPGMPEQPPLAELQPGAKPPPIVPYAYRSFDRQWCFADSRLGDFLRPILWAAHGKKQVYVASLLTKPLGEGPALTATEALPDLDFFSGRGAKDIVPLYRDPEGNEPNIMPGLLERLEAHFGFRVSAEDFLAYVYAVLAHPGFTRRFAQELERREVRVPLTRSGDLFRQGVRLGRRLLWLHTFATRYCTPRQRPKGKVPRGEARCTKPVPRSEADYPERFSYDPETRTLHVGRGAFAPVAAEVYEFEVSGLKVVQSWLGYRMRRRRGRQSSVLDRIGPRRWPPEFTRQLLELLWVLEATLKLYPRQEALLDQICHTQTVTLP